MSQARLVVSNTTPISNLIRIQQLPLLQQLFERVVIPAQVAEELDRGKHVLGVWQEAPGASALLEAKRQGYVQEVRPLVDALERANFRVSAALKAHVLSTAGEA